MMVNAWLPTVPLTCASDARCHEITDGEMTAGFRARSGRHLALCGHTVVATPMLQPGGVPCPRCVALITPELGRVARHRWRHGHRRLLPGYREGFDSHDPGRPTRAFPRVSPPLGGRALTAAGPESTPTSSGPAALDAMAGTSVGRS